MHPATSKKIRQSRIFKKGRQCLPNSRLLKMDNTVCPIQGYSKMDNTASLIQNFLKRTDTVGEIQNQIERFLILSCLGKPNLNTLQTTANIVKLEI